MIANFFKEETKVICTTKFNLLSFHNLIVYFEHNYSPCQAKNTAEIKY